MKILWLYGSNEMWDSINHWYHMDFANVLKQQPNVDLMAYGWNLETVWKELAPITFNPIITAKDLKAEFDFDVIIMDNKNRFFRDPRKKKTTQWLSDSFFDGMNNIPKIMIEGDYHQHKIQYLSEDWFMRTKIDLLLHRHVSNVKRSLIDFPYIKSGWLPCSVDINKFKPNPNIQRTPLVCFIGGWSPGLYTYRNIAAKNLAPSNLLKVYNQRLLGQDYIDCLQSYVSHLNCSSKYSITTAKMFEIMASGSVLLTDESDDYGLKELFVDESYCTYKRDGSDVIKKANLIINEPNYRDLVTNRAINCIKEKHTHEIRAKELIKTIETNFKISPSLPLKLWLIDKLCSTKELKELIQFKQPKSFDNAHITLQKESPKEPIIELTVEELYNKLISLNIKFWLLKETCFEVILYHKLPKNKLQIGVESEEIKELIENKVPCDKLSITIDPNRPIKKMIVNEKEINVPMPVTKYLERFTGKNWRDLNK